MKVAKLWLQILRLMGAKTPFLVLCSKYASFTHVKDYVQSFLFSVVISDLTNILEKPLSITFLLLHEMEVACIRSVSWAFQIKFIFDMKIGRCLCSCICYSFHNNLHIARVIHYNQDRGFLFWIDFARIVAPRWGHRVATKETALSHFCGESAVFF